MYLWYVELNKAFNNYNKGLPKLVFFLSGNCIDAASRYRGYFVVEELRKCGYNVLVFDSPIFRRRDFSAKKAIKFLLDFTVNFLQKLNILSKNGNSIFFIERDVISTLPGRLNIIGEFATIFLIIIAKKFFKIHFIYDFDDAIYLSKPFATNILTRCADIVVVGSHKLEQYAISLNPHVSLIPTCVPLTKYQTYTRDKKHETDNLVLGWIGGQSSLKYLNLLAKPLQALTRKYSFELRIIGARDAEEYKIYASDLLKSFRGINIKLIPWTLETELYELSKFDIGLMPLTNGEKEKGKCGFKIIQYMAMGIPSVASNVGENVHIVTESVDGFLCSNSIDWINKLSILLDNADVRYQMGDSALKKAQEYYALEIRVKEISCLIHHLYVKSQKRVSH